MDNFSTGDDSDKSCWRRIGVAGDRSCEKLPQHAHCRNCDAYADTASHIMQRPLPSGYQQEWAEHFAQREKTEQTADQAALVFRIGREWLALPARLSITIADPATPHRLPHRGGNVLAGIVNVRGTLYPCMSLAGLIGIGLQEPPPRPGRHAYPRLLVMQLGQQAFALPVQDLQGIHRYALSELQALPLTSEMTLHRYLTGVLSLTDMRIGLLDAELLGARLAGVLK